VRDEICERVTDLLSEMVSEILLPWVGTWFEGAGSRDGKTVAGAL
jgi:hypothetical protein